MATIEKRGGMCRVKIRRGYESVSAASPAKKDAQIWARKTESQMDARTFVDCSRADTTTLRQVLVKYREDEVPRHR